MKARARALCVSGREHTTRRARSRASVGNSGLQFVGVCRTKKEKWELDLEWQIQASYRPMSRCQEEL